MWSTEPRARMVQTNQARLPAQVPERGRLGLALEKDHKQSQAG